MGEEQEDFYDQEDSLEGCWDKIKFRVPCWLQSTVDFKLFSVSDLYMDWSLIFC